MSMVQFTSGGGSGSGERGPEGPAGKEGPEGKAGTNGTNGTNGAVGERGPEGVVGPKGTTGEKGLTGEKGEKGATGVGAEPGVPEAEKTVANLETITVTEPTTVYLSVQYKLEVINPTLSVTVDGKTVFKGVLKDPNTVEAVAFLTIHVKAGGKYVVSAGTGVEKITAVHQAF